MQRIPAHTRSEVKALWDPHVALAAVALRLPACFSPLVTSFFVPPRRPIIFLQEKQSSHIRAT